MNKNIEPLLSVSTCVMFVYFSYFWVFDIDKSNLIYTISGLCLAVGLAWLYKPERVFVAGVYFVCIVEFLVLYIFFK
jgi:hypothetical protein